jgi:hypothetical protein
MVAQPTHWHYLPNIATIPKKIVAIAPTFCNDSQAYRKENYSWHFLLNVATISKKWLQ